MKFSMFFLAFLVGCATLGQPKERCAGLDPASETFAAGGRACRNLPAATLGGKVPADWTGQETRATFACGDTATLTFRRGDTGYARAVARFQCSVDAVNEFLTTARSTMTMMDDLDGTRCSARLSRHRSGDRLGMADQAIITCGHYTAILRSYTLQDDRHPIAIELTAGDGTAGPMDQPDNVVDAPDAAAQAARLEMLLRTIQEMEDSVTIDLR